MSVNTKDCVRRALLAQVDRAKFHTLAEPGDQLLLTAELNEQIDDAAKIDVSVQCDGAKIAGAKLTFVLKAIDSDKIHAQRRYCYQLWTKKLKSDVEII